MNIKQLTYTSNIKTGLGNDRCFGEPSHKEREFFNSICSHASTTGTILEYVYGEGTGIFYRSVPSGVDAAGRNRFYAHGYVFSESDCDEVFGDYSSFLGENYFMASEADEIKEKGIFSKPYKKAIKLFDKELIVSAIYEVLFKGKKMEVSYEGADGEALIRTFMNTIYGYIPLQLRKFITFSSGLGSYSRDVTAVEFFSSYAEISVNLSGGEIKGLDGSFKDFVSVMFKNDPQDFISEFEKYLSKITFVGKKEFLAAAESLIEEALFAEEAKSPVSIENINETLSRVLLRKKYTSKTDANYLKKILSAMQKSNIFAPLETNAELYRFFEECDSAALKKGIISYFALQFETEDTLSEVIGDFFSEQYSEEFKVSLLKALFEKENDSSIISISKKAIKDEAFCSFVKKNCDEDIIKTICETIAGRFKESHNKREFLESVFASPLFAQIIEILSGDAVLGEGDFYNYMCVALSSPETLNKHLGLDEKTRRLFDSLFAQFSLLKQEDAVEILEKAYTAFHTTIYFHLEEVLIEYGNHSIVELFYADFVSAKATSASALEKQKKHLESRNVPTQYYIDKVITAYADFCFKEEEKSTSAIKKIYDFSERDSIENIPGIEEIKIAFWKTFSFKSFDFEDNVRLMAVKENQKSILANALLSLYEYLCKKSDNIDSDTFSLCRKGLCTKQKTISKKAQELLLEKLKAKNISASSDNIDALLLVNYKRSKKTVDFREIDISEKDLCTYIKENVKNKESMLHTGKVLKSVYKHIYKKNKKEEEKSTAKEGTYAYALKLIEEKTSYAPIHLEDIFVKEHIISVYSLIILILSGIGIASMLCIDGSTAVYAKYIIILAAYASVFSNFIVLTVKRIAKRKIDLFSVFLSLLCILSITACMIILLYCQSEVLPHDQLQ